jgi:hypothetical protein
MAGVVTTKSIRDANGNAVTMRVWDESGAGTGPFSFFTVLGADGIKLAKAEDAAAANGDEGIVLFAKRTDTPANSSGTDGDYETLQVSGGLLWTDAKAHGDVASGSSDSGNPVKVGGVGKTANPTAVSDGQRVNALYDKLGKMIAVGAIRDLKGVQKTTITSSTSETTIVTAVASTFLDLYGLVMANTSATACNMTIKDATSGTTRAIFAVPAGETRGFMLPVDSAIPQASVNNNWTATCGTSVSAIEITALYVKNL